MNRTCAFDDVADCLGEVSLVLLPDNETHLSLCEEHMVDTDSALRFTRRPPTQTACQSWA